MPKTKAVESALHDWVHELPFQMQALLMTGVRGPDGCSKHNAAKALVRYLRGAVLKPAGDWSGENDNDFMWGRYVRRSYREESFNYWSRQFFHDYDQYPMHFIMHLIHCAEVLGYKHPDEDIRIFWRSFYNRACSSFHMHPEEEWQMDERLDDFGCGYVEPTQRNESEHRGEIVVEDYVAKFPLTPDDAVNTKEETPTRQPESSDANQSAGGGGDQGSGSEKM